MKAVEMLLAAALCVLYIGVSTGMISFNKYLLAHERFPYPLVLTSFHMTMMTVLSFIFSSIAPSWYPSLKKAMEKKTLILKYIGMVAILYAGSLFLSNAAYMYASVAFLQFIKETNPTTVYVLSCFIGLQYFSWRKVGIIAWILFGCSLCVHGEIHFKFVGLAFQVTAVLCECSKNVLLEWVLTGADLKLDVLTTNLLMAPLTLIPLLIGVAIEQPEGVLPAVVEYWQLLLPNTLVAFALNISLVLVLKRLSATTFVMIGILKDIMIVTASVALFGDPISTQQLIGFLWTLVGLGVWSYVKATEKIVPSETSEITQSNDSPLLKSRDSDSEEEVAEAAPGNVKFP